jgi:hypothetical protein
MCVARDTLGFEMQFVNKGGNAYNKNKSRH